MKWVLYILALLLLTGCGAGLPQPRELGGMALMREMTVETGSQPGTVLVEVSDGEDNGDGASAQRSTLAGACQAIREAGENTAFLGHVDRLTLGEELVKTGGVETTLRYFGRDRELGLGAGVWLAGEGAEGLTALRTTAEEVLANLLEEGWAVLPAPGGEYGILKEGTLVCRVTGGAARGLELARGCPPKELVELGAGAVKVNGVTVTCTPVMDWRELVGLELDVRLRANVAQRGEGSGLSHLRGQLERRAEQWLTGAVTLAQGENVDFMGLKRMAGMNRPECWKLICQQWGEKFPALAVTVTCTAALTEPGGSGHGAE